MVNFLVRKFIRDYEHTEDAQVRTRYGVLAGTVGIICNILLFAGKLAVGLGLHSISVIADAFNNLSDAAASVIGFIGVRLASKPADENHPFGHERIEYIAALIVAFLVIEVGLSFFKGSIEKIREPEELIFGSIPMLVLLVSILVKLWLAYFNRTLGKRIHSGVMQATATDAMGDVITTAATAGSILFFHFTGKNVDGFVGIAVALVVMWAGIKIIKDTLEPLIGGAVNPEIYRKITESVEKYDGVLGSHDLIVHNYGPTKNLASIHAEVPNDMDIETSHEIIDRIERDAARELGVFLVIHMDPLETRNERVATVKSQVAEALKGIDARLSLHDFRMVDGEQKINLIFDVVVPYTYREQELAQLHLDIVHKVGELDARYQCVLTLEKSYVAEG